MAKNINCIVNFLMNSFRKFLNRSIANKNQVGNHDEIEERKRSFRDKMFKSYSSIEKTH